MTAQGWYKDPFSVHDERWFSDGHATSLVRDQGTESNDPPPDTKITEPLVPSTETGSANCDDLKRADQPYVRKSYIDAALDAGAQSGIGFS